MSDHDSSTRPSARQRQGDEPLRPDQAPGRQARPNEEAVIGGIGNTNFDLWAAGQRPQNFYMLGSMGLAIPIALGVALAQPQRHVFALEGDGSLLMQLGCLATIAMLRAEEPHHRRVGQRHLPDHRQPADRDRRGRRYRRDRARRRHRARAPGRPTRRISTAWSTRARRGGPSLIAARIDEQPGVGATERDPVQIRDRFMRGLGVRRAPAASG